MDQPAVESTSRRPKAALWALACAALLAACAGENLFTDPTLAGLGDVGPTVDVTEPTENAEVAIGAAIGVSASTTAAAGAVTARVSSHYVGSSNTAYGAANLNLFNQTEAEFEVTINAVAGQIAGQAYIVVEVTDALGLAGKDSVKVTIGG